MLSASNSTAKVPTGYIKVMFVPYKNSVNNEYKVDPGKYKVHIAYGSDIDTVFTGIGTVY